MLHLLLFVFILDIFRFFCGRFLFGDGPPYSLGLCVVVPNGPCMRFVVFVISLEGSGAATFFCAWMFAAVVLRDVGAVYFKCFFAIATFVSPCCVWRRAPIV